MPRKPAYNKELKWYMGVLKLSTHDDYLLNSVCTSGFYVGSAAIVLGTKCATKESMKWLMSDAKIVTASAKLGRCLNDISSHKRERKLGQTRTAVDIYMKQHGLSLPATVDKFVELGACLWKDMNAGWMDKTHDIPKDVMEAVLNFARTTKITYKNCHDRFTSPEAVYT